MHIHVKVSRWWNVRAGEGLLNGSPAGVVAPWLALRLFRAFAAEEADDALRTQAVRCLVFLAPRLGPGAQALPVLRDSTGVAADPAPSSGNAIVKEADDGNDNDSGDDEEAAGADDLEDEQEALAESGMP